MRILAFLMLFLFGFSRPAFAAISVNIENVPNSVNIDEEFTADVILTCTNCGTSYLRGVFFYPESSTTYSGYTQNNSGEWINLPGLQASSYFKVEEGSWSGKLKLKFDLERSAGDYFFKVGRYTASGSSFAQVSDAKAVVVLGPSPTPTVTLTPTPTPAPITTPTSTPTKTPTPTSTPTVRLTATPTATLSGLVLATSQSADSSISAVLSAENQSLAVDEPELDNVANFAFVGVLVATFGLLALIYRRLKLLAIK